jgi:hypothetical protein
MTAEELQAEQISQHGNGCSNEKVLCNQHALLTLWLMQEHQLGDESKWHAYLQSLPLPSVELLPALSTHYSSISTRLPWNLRGTPILYERYFIQIILHRIDWRTEGKDSEGFSVDSTLPFVRRFQRWSAAGAIQMGLVHG